MRKKAIETARALQGFAQPMAHLLRLAQAQRRPAGPIGAGGAAPGACLSIKDDRLEMCGCLSDLAFLPCGKSLTPVHLGRCAGGELCCQTRNFAGLFTIARHAPAASGTTSQGKAGQITKTRCSEVAWRGSDVMEQVGDALILRCCCHSRKIDAELSTRLRLARRGRLVRLTL